MDSNNRYEADGDCVRDQDAGTLDQVLCACGFTQEDADGGVSHRAKSSCSAEPAAIEAKAERMAREWSEIP